MAHRVAVEFAAAFPGAPNPVIVDSFHDLPDAVKREAAEQGVSENGKGVVHDGAFYVARKNIAVARVATAHASHHLSVGRPFLFTFLFNISIGDFTNKINFCFSV